jgi:hypothetical protein
VIKGHIVEGMPPTPLRFTVYDTLRLGDMIIFRKLTQSRYPSTPYIDPYHNSHTPHVHPSRIAQASRRRVGPAVQTSTAAGDDGFGIGRRRVCRGYTRC